MKKLNKISLYILAVFSFALLIASCESEFDPIPFNESEIVVEGAIEAARTGEFAFPTYVIVTKSQPFFREFTGFQNLFVKDAKVWVANGKDSIELQRFCWSELDTTQRRLVGQSLNLNLDSLNRDFELCIYIDILGRIRGEVGKTYNLNIALADGRRITSSTRIPRIIPVDSVEFIKPPGENQNDTLAQMRAWVNDPKGGPDFYRYFSSINNGGYTAGRNSVADDAFFDGINTKFNLLRSVPRGETIDQPELFGLWRRGDSISIKFCTIDENSYDFWNTLEQSANRGGPFANYLKTKHNVVGGLGGWCGYGVSYFNARVPKLKK